MISTFHRVIIWNTTTGERMRTLKDGSLYVNDLAVLGDHRLVQVRRMSTMIITGLLCHHVGQLIYKLSFIGLAW